MVCPTPRLNTYLCRGLGLDDQVRFLGHVDDLPALLMRNRIAVLSSHYEGFGLSLAEGMAAGCAAVGTSVPGIRTLIQGTYSASP